MVKPVHIFIDGRELLGWTQMSLGRSKDDMTGNLSVTMFFSYLPDSPVVTQATRSKEILVYIGGHLAFTGVVDKRTGAGIKGGQARDENGQFTSGGAGDSGGGGVSYNIGPNEYTVTLSARGKTKYLIDSSHQHPTTNMLRPTTQDVVKKLVEPWEIELDWLAQDVKLDKVRLRDGGRVVDELHRVATENGHFMYETRDGRLRVTDDVGPDMGDDLILGVNILRFSAEQSEESARSEVTVKGQRTEREQWGESAVLNNTMKQVQDNWVGATIPLTVQHYGDGTPEALERRATFEMNKRSAQSKKVTIPVFHVQSASGRPWDIGTQHYVQIPPEGLADIMECTGVQYEVDAGGTLQTTLTLSPPPTSGGAAGGAGGGLLSGLAALGGPSSSAAAVGVTIGAGQYPSPWSGPDLEFLQVANNAATLYAGATGLLSGLTTALRKPPMSLPPEYGDD